MAAELCLLEGAAAAPGDWEPPQLTASQLHWLSRHIKALAEVSPVCACFICAPHQCVSKMGMVSMCGTARTCSLKAAAEEKRTASRGNMRKIPSNLCNISLHPTVWCEPARGCAAELAAQGCARRQPGRLYQAPG